MIHRFRVQNFKSIADVDVALSPVTVLVGKSGTGKSSFVQALQALKNALLSPRSMMGSWSRFRPATGADSPTTFYVEFSVSGMPDVFSYYLAVNNEGRADDPVEERLTLGDRCLFHQVTAGPHAARWEVVPEVVHVPAPGAIAIGRITSISDIVIAFTALTSGIGCYGFSDRVLCIPTNANQRAMGLADDAGDFLDAIRDIVSNLQDLSIRKSMISALQRLNPSISAVELDDIQRPKKVVVGHRFDGKTLALDLSQESDGFRRFYAHLLAIYQRPPKQTLIFEHPEDGIHPGALSLLADEFKAAPGAGRGQMILTTHSPKLLDQFDIEQIRVVELVGLETRIGFISDEQKEAIHDKLLDPGELLTVDPARGQLAVAGA